MTKIHYYSLSCAGEQTQIQISLSHNEFLRRGKVYFGVAHTVEELRGLGPQELEQVTQQHHHIFIFVSFSLLLFVC